MARASVRTRLALWYAGILAATLALLGGLAYVILAQGLHRDVDQSLMAVARSAADWAAHREGNPGQPSIEDLVRELFGASPFERFLQLLDPGGHPLAMSPNVAGLIVEMAGALNSGHMRALEQRSSRNTTSTSFETFVQEEFIPVFRGQKQAA